MTAASWWLLALAATFAVGDWVSVSGLARRVARAEYVCKPATLGALLAVAAALGTPDPGRRAWFLAALVLCLAGDVALMLPGDRMAAFGAGLGSFFVAQLCFIAGLSRQGGGWASAMVALVVIAAVTAPATVAVVRAVRRGAHRWLAGPVLAYMAALLVMAAMAWSAGFGGSPLGDNPLVAAGGALFVVSDTALAVDRFVRPLARGTLAVHLTYHVAVGLLVVSLAGVP